MNKPITKKDFNALLKHLSERKVNLKKDYRS